MQLVHIGSISASSISFRYLISLNLLMIIVKKISGISDQYGLTEINICRFGVVVLVIEPIK